MAHFKFFVIGAGSGGIAAARRAANYGVKVGIGESNQLGGTCVNRGCVPKKMMWYCASVKQMLGEAHYYGHSITQPYVDSFSWDDMKNARTQAISKLRRNYETGLKEAGISVYSSIISFVKIENNIFHLKAGTDIITAEHVLIATGGTPTKLSIKGFEHCINSDDFFDLEKQPKSVAIVGSGYIAVELASIFTLLQTNTYLLIRGSYPLRKFDKMLGVKLKEELIKQGCKVHSETQVVSVEKNGSADTLTLHLQDRKQIIFLDAVLVAVGRDPDIKKLNLNSLSQLKLTSTKHIIVDDLQNTSIPHLYALGDVCGKVELTPMAVAAGRRLADRLFGNNSNAKADYENVPSVIFTHPCIGTIGLAEAKAKQRYGEHNIRVYQSTSICLYYTIFNIPNEKKPKVHIKLVCLIPEDDKILGLHIIGMGADEILQGFAVAIKMGAKKKDFDNCIAIHPTVAEEIVTLPPWGLPC